MARRIRVGAVVYREVEDGEEWFIAVEPMTGAQAQGRSVEEALERLREEVVKMGDAWCESEMKEAVEARLIEVEVPED